MLKVRMRNMIDADDIHVSRIGLPAPPWLISYADLMTELTIFFIVMYAMAAALSRDLQVANKNIQEVMRKEHIEGQVKIEKDGLRVSVQDSVQTANAYESDGALFESGKSELSESMRTILDKMAPTLKELSTTHTIVVEGHTDDVPIKTKAFDSNWELSTARATSVVRHLIDGLGFPPEHLAAIGYGQQRPAAPNDSPENRAKNRRVVFFVKPEKSAGAVKAEEPGK